MAIRTKESRQRTLKYMGAGVIARIEASTSLIQLASSRRYASGKHHNGDAARRTRNRLALIECWRVEVCRVQSL